jgi:small basic protein
LDATADGSPNASISSPQWPAIILWVAVVIALSAALARIAVCLQTAHLAAVGIFPMILGAVIGVCVVWSGRQLGITNRGWLLLVSVVAAITLSLAEHGFFYLDYRNHYSSEIQNNPKAQLFMSLAADEFQPASFSHFMAAEAPAKWPLWIIDALAMIAVSALVTYFLTRPVDPVVSGA